MDFRIFLRHIKINILLPIYQKGLVWRLRHKEKINVVFIASSLSMWRYQNLYELLENHPRFNASILILPFNAYTKEQQAIEVEKLVDFFRTKKSSYYLSIKEDNRHIDIRKDLKPDILFYPQPYWRNYEKEYDFDRFQDKLLCYCPYAFWMSRGGWSYSQPLHNLAWKLFYSTDLHKKEAQEYALNKGRNVEVVGYPNADAFLVQKHTDIWKPQKRTKKRIIWAPHFTINSGKYVAQSNFLWMAELMLIIADKYLEHIQLIFKPHPHLFTALCHYDAWGEEKARQYYEKWQSKENTQVENGEFVDLFMTSDAMIHDSGSFCVEYHYSGNPVMYVANNFEEQVAEKSEFGQLAMRQHYVGQKEEDIIHFIEDVVLAGNDPMKEGREEFVRQYLIPPYGKTVAQNMMDVLMKNFC